MRTLPPVLGCRLFFLALAFLVLSGVEASATVVEMTGGSIVMLESTPLPFDDVFVTLEGDGFELTNYFLHDSFVFAGTPHPANLHSPGTELDFSGTAFLVSPLDRLVYGGVEYQASGEVTVTSERVAISELFTVPFLLSGTIHGVSLTGSETIELEVTGGGTTTVRYVPRGDLLQLSSIRHEVASIPEPTTWALVGSGLACLAARARRRPGSAGRSKRDDDHRPA